jgi:hypothetical protein
VISSESKGNSNGDSDFMQFRDYYLQPAHMAFTIKAGKKGHFSSKRRSALSQK